MERVTHTVMVFKAGALNADGKGGEELSLCRYRTRMHQWWHDGKNRGCVDLFCARVNRGVPGYKEGASKC